MSSQKMPNTQKIIRVKSVERHQESEYECSYILEWISDRVAHNSGCMFLGSLEAHLTVRPPQPTGLDVFPTISHENANVMLRKRSTYLALSQAPPVLLAEIAICTPDTRAPARTPATASAPSKKPTTKGVAITSAPGAIYTELWNGSLLWNRVLNSLPSR